ncbi:putrescine-ornithine antiporter [Enterovibrio paralichthyis]|uniref:putrescine-ornithine antiporter n=1 Tax=Enterovibrio paralichthyis TaxID=2853805 RepID=UPI001C43FCCE|nr:putrescine-ornithine antiporter [Enterovibrio paralichthyis]MBV7297114.1 putrescine-ornithine antiporter [Enterovibrio paralichthyis]
MSSDASSKKMGLVGLTVLVAVNMMGSGIIMLPASLAQVGAISLLSWVVTALGAMCIAYTFAKCGAFCKRSGGMSAYSEEAHGKSSFFISSYTYYVCLVISCVAIAVSAVGYIKPFMPWLDTPMHTFYGVVAILVLTMVANFGGPKITGQISSVTVWGIILPVLGLSLIGWWWFDPQTFMSAWNPHHDTTIHSVSSGIALTLWAFLGIESAGANSDAVENPERNVPLAVLFGTGFAAVVYILSTTVIQGIIPNAELANSTAPFGLVLSHMFNPTVGNIVTLAAVTACIGSLLGWQFTNAQVSKAAAEEGLFPMIFAKTNRFGAPIMGMLIMLAAELVLAVMTISPDLVNQFNALLNLAVFVNMVPYILSMTGLEVMLRKNHVTPAQYKLGATVGTLGVIYSIYGVYACGADAVFGGTILTLFGYIFYGFIAARDVNKKITNETEVKA